jgi:hypothetical protein
MRPAGCEPATHSLRPQHPPASVGGRLFYAGLQGGAPAGASDYRGVLLPLALPRPHVVLAKSRTVSSRLGSENHQAFKAVPQSGSISGKRPLRFELTPGSSSATFGRPQRGS